MSKGSNTTRLIEGRDNMVAMRDGVKLAIDVYRPDAPGKFPVLYACALHNEDMQGPDMSDALPPQPAYSPLWFGPIEAAIRGGSSRKGTSTSLRSHAVLRNRKGAFKTNNGITTMSSSGSPNNPGAMAKSGWSVSPHMPASNGARLPSSIRP